MALPDTIRHKSNFKRSTPAGFDGAMHYDWINEAFSDTRITGTDFDCVVERWGHFLIIESKDEKKKVPRGQIITLSRLWAAGKCTVFFSSPKDRPEIIHVVWERELEYDPETHYIQDFREAMGLVSRWRRIAERSPCETPVRRKVKEFFNNLSE